MAGMRVDGAGRRSLFCSSYRLDNHHGFSCEAMLDVSSVSSMEAIIHADARRESPIYLLAKPALCSKPLAPGGGGDSFLAIRGLALPGDVPRQFAAIW